MYAKLNDLVLGPDSGAAWSQISGVAPYSVDIEVEREAAVALVKKAKTHSAKFEIMDDNETVVIWDHLTILGSSPTTSPYLNTVRVVDRRWEWPRLWIKRSYNIRRKTGRTKKMPNANADLANLQQEVDYHPWSLNTLGQPWNAEEVLDDILFELTGFYHKIQLPGVELPAVEGLEIDSPGDVALGRALSMFGGGVGVKITSEGMTIVYDKLSGKEIGLVGGDDTTKTRERGAESSALPMVVGYPVWSMQDRHLERPKSVKVLFTRAVEIRFDADEKPDRPAALTQERGEAPFKIENVMPLPEDMPTFFIGGIDVSGTTALPIGSWVTIDDYLFNLSKERSPTSTRYTPSSLPKLSKDILNRAWLHSALEAYGMLDPSGLWARRIAALRTHYRRTYRVAKPYSERVREFWARRVKLQDQATSGFLTSPCWFDYAAYTTWRATNANKAADGPDPADIVKNRWAHPKTTSDSWSNIIASPISELSAAPASISMIDPQLGIFSIDFYPDISSKAINYIHSGLVNSPNENPNNPRPWLQDGHLFTNRELSCLLSTIPQAPNDNRQLYSIEVKQDSPSIRASGGDSEAHLQADGEGPTITVRVDPNIAMARFEWADIRGPKLREWFVESIDPAGEDFGTPEGDLDAFGEPLNANELMAVAKIKAKEIYTRYVDHVEGGITTGLRPDIELVGSATAIRHEAGKDGALTTVSLPPDPPALDLGQLMPPSVRRLVQGGGEV